VTTTGDGAARAVAVAAATTAKDPRITAQLISLTLIIGM
jgi:hypothetical protein